MLCPSLFAAVLLAAGPEPIAVSVPARKEPVSYSREVADILDAKCVGCHSAALAEAKLNMEEVAGMLKGGKHGPAIVPGKADDSLLFKMSAHRVEPVMPPVAKKDAKPLTSAELGIIQLWINAGAKDDSEENPDAVKTLELGALPPGVQPIVAVDLNAEGTRIAAGRANVVQVYDADSGLEINALGGHKDIIQSIRFSPDGKRLAAGSYQVVTLWNLPTGGLAKSFAGHSDQVKTIAVTADRKTMFSGSLDRTIRVWSLESGKQERQFASPAQVFGLSLSPDGTTLAAAGQDGSVHVFQAADGKLLASLKGHAGPVIDVAYLPDGRRVVSVSADGTGRIWKFPEDAAWKTAKSPNHVKLDEPLALKGHAGALRSVAVTGDGETIVTAGDDATVRCWHAADGTPERTLEGGTGPVLAVAINPKGDLVLTGGADKVARLYNRKDGTLMRSLPGHLGAIQTVAFSPNGERLVTAGAEGGMKVWETATGQGVIAFGHTAPNNAAIQGVQDVAFRDDGGLISASADRTLKSWTFEGSWSALPSLSPHVFRVLAIDFSPDGKLLATGGGEPSRSGEVKIWDVEKATVVRLLDSLHSDTVFGVRFSPDGTKLATGAADKFLKVIDVASGKDLKSFEGHTHHVLAVDWKSDGKQLVTGGADNVLKVWDFETGEQLRTLQPAGKQVTAVRWSPGKADVIGASGDTLVRIWNADSGNIGRNLAGAGDYVFGIGVSKAGDRVAAGGADSILFYWNAADGKILRKIEPPAPPSAKTAATKP